MFKQIEEDLLSLDSADVQYDENGVARYYVERICEMRYAYPSGREYRVKWKGCSMDLSTWEPEQNLEKDPVVHKMMKDFENQLCNSDTAKKMSVIINRHGTGQNRLMQTKFMIEGIEAQFAGDGIQTWRVVDNQALQHSGRRPEVRREYRAPRERVYEGEDSFSEGIKNQRRPQVQSEARAVSKDEFGETIRQPRVRSRQNRQSVTYNKDRSRDAERFQRNQGELPHDRAKAQAEEIRVKNEDIKRQTQEYEPTSSAQIKDRYTSGSPDDRRRYSSKDNGPKRPIWNEESSRRSGKIPPPESSSIKKAMPARKSANYRRAPNEDIDVTPAEEQRQADSEEPSQRIDYQKARNADRRKSSQGKVQPRRYQDDSPEPELEPSEDYQRPQRSKSNKQALNKGFRVPLRERVSSSIEKKAQADADEKSSSIKRRPAVKTAALQEDSREREEEPSSKSRTKPAKLESLERESEGYKQISKKTTLLALAGRRRAAEGEKAKLAEFTSDDGELAAPPKRATMLKPSELEEFKRESLNSGSEERVPMIISKKTPSSRPAVSKIDEEYVEDSSSKRKRGGVTKNEDGSLEVGSKRKSKAEKVDEEFAESGLSSEEIQRRKEYKRRKEQKKEEEPARSASNLLRKRKYIEDEEDKKVKSRSRSRRRSKSRDKLRKDYERKLKTLRRRSSRDGRSKSRRSSKKSRSRSRRHSRSSRKSRSRSARREEKLARRGSRHRSRSSKKSRSRSGRRMESLNKLSRRKSRSISSKHKRGHSSRSKSRHSKRSRSRRSADLRKNRSSSGHRHRSGSRRSRKSHSSRHRSNSRRSQSRGKDRPTSRREIEHFLEHTDIAKIVRAVTIDKQSYFEVKWQRDRHGKRPQNSLIRDEYLAKINPKLVIEWMDAPEAGTAAAPPN